MPTSLLPSLLRPLLHVVLLCGALAACGGPKLTDTEATRIRRELRERMSQPVPDRATRDAHSRALAEAIESGALDRLDQSQVRAHFGRGRACQTEVCKAAGFGPSDWYWEIGQATSDDIGQLPVLIIGFDARGIGTRLYNLSTH